MSYPTRFFTLTLALIAALSMSACGPDANATPTIGADAIFTSAAQTFEANRATESALVPPTETPSPSPFPTFSIPSPLATISFASPTPLTGGTSACDNAAYLADVTIPDGTIMSPGQGFTKTWKMYNSGTCPWSTGYKLVFSGGDSMGATSAFLPISVPIGGTIDISVNLTAPSGSGSFKSNWQLQNDKNQSFGSIVYVQIQIGAGNSVTPGATSSTGTVTISGSAELPDVVITYTGDSGKYQSGSVLSGDGGAYSFTVPSGWYGSVQPSKGDWTFTPPSRDYVNVTSNQTGQNYGAE